MRIPLRTETDAFRVAAGLALAALASVLAGWLSSPAYGVVLFASAAAAGITFELAGRERADATDLREAAIADHAHGAVAGRRHVLVVADEALAGEELRGVLAAAGAGLELDVLAPILASRSHYWGSDIDREREDARRRLEASLAWAAEHGFTARGEVGDPDLLAAVADELRDFGADEVIIAGRPRKPRNWLADRMLAQLERELDVPVREIAVAEQPRE